MMCTSAEVAAAAAVHKDGAGVAEAEPCSPARPEASWSNLIPSLEFHQLLSFRDSSGKLRGIDYH